MAPVLRTLTTHLRTDSPDHNAKGTRSDTRRPKPPDVLPPLVGTRFQDLFHSPPGVLFTFPSRYWSTIGHEGVFSLGGWSPRLPAGFHVSRGTRDTARGLGASRTGLSPSLAGLSRPRRLAPRTPTSRSHNPDPASRIGLGWSPFAHRYWGNRGCFLFLRVLRCFSSPGWPPLARIRELTPPGVAPFGHPGITACVRLPRAYRSLPRPSSPPRAKASTVRLFALDLKPRVLLSAGFLSHHVTVFDCQGAPRTVASCAS